jgi:hypothetical protein
MSRVDDRPVAPRAFPSTPPCALFLFHAPRHPAHVPCSENHAGPTAPLVDVLVLLLVGPTANPARSGLARRGDRLGRS